MYETVRRESHVKRVYRETAALMQKSSTLPLLLAAFLFCLLVTVAAYCLTELGFYLVTVLTDSLTAQTVLELLLLLFALLLAISAVMPLWLGKLRMAGLFWQGTEPVPRELFYYFTSPARYARAWRTGALTLLLLLLPIFAVLGLFGGVWSLYNAVFTVYLSGPAAVLLLLVCWVLALGASVAILFFSCSFVCFTAVAVGNEGMRVRHAFALAVKAGKAHLADIFIFALKSLLWLALSLVTVGVLYVLWFSHYYNLSYLRLAMALCPKEEV